MIQTRENPLAGNQGAKKISDGDSRSVPNTAGIASANASPVVTVAEYKRWEIERYLAQDRTMAGAAK